MVVTSLVPRPSAASFLVAYVTFEPLSDLMGVQRSHIRLEAADGLGTSLGHDYI